MGGQEMGKLELEGPQGKRMQTSPHVPRPCFPVCPPGSGPCGWPGRCLASCKGAQLLSKSRAFLSGCPSVSAPPAAPAGEASLAHLVVLTSVLPSPCGGPVPPQRPRGL